MVEFHETKAGRVFLERTLPELVRAIERLAAAVEALARASEHGASEDERAPRPWEGH